MARPVKLSDKNKPWCRRSQLDRERSYETREERERFLIVCEGQKTEPNYFEAFKMELPRNLVEVEIHGEGSNTLSLVVRAQEIRDGRAKGDYPFDQVWVVFDRNSFDADDFDNAMHKAEAEAIHCAWSNEAFELWYILHFEYRNTGMHRAEYEGRLSALLSEPYRKNASDMYQKLLPKQPQAVQWSRKLHEEFLSSGKPPSRANPCTTVFQLVEELNRFRVTRVG